jgi:hypothetical protein
VIHKLRVVQKRQIAVATQQRHRQGDRRTSNRLMSVFPPAMSNQDNIINRKGIYSPCRSTQLYFLIVASSILVSRFLRFLPPLLQFSSSQTSNSPRTLANSSLTGSAPSGRARRGFSSRSNSECQRSVCQYYGKHQVSSAPSSINVFYLPA